MQVQSVSNQAFQGHRDRVDAMIKLDDRLIQQKAYEKALTQVDDKKNKRITNLLIYSAPIASGVATALLTDRSNTTLFTKEISGVAGRMAKGLKATAFFGTALAAINLLGLARNKLSEKSQDVRNFERKHPTAAFMTALGAGIAALTALPFGIARAGKLFTPEFTEKVASKVGKYAEKLNNSNPVDVMKNAYNKLGERTPNWIKIPSMVALDWSPAALLLGGIANSLYGANEKAAAFVDNYNKMKEKQVNLSRARLREISDYAVMQNMMLQKASLEKAALEAKNDFLMQDLNNQKEMAILADGVVSDMPQEVIDKVDAIRAKREAENISNDAEQEIDNSEENE